MVRDSILSHSIGELQESSERGGGLPGTWERLYICSFCVPRKCENPVSSLRAKAGDCGGNRAMRGKTRSGGASNVRLQGWTGS